jgi:alpha-1,6-mannosyltransferase
MAALISGIVFVAFYTNRVDFLSYFLPYSIAFVGYFLVVKKKENQLKLKNQDYLAAVFLRIFVLFSIPNLSDDVYRFIWDGLLLRAGINPYSITPENWIYGNGCGLYEFEFLYGYLNSPNYYSIYPPILQWFFWLSVIPGLNIYGSIILLKGSIFLAEMTTLYLLPRFLRKIGFPEGKALWYLFNPLIIIELLGNIHFEALAIPFLLIGLATFKGSRFFASGSFTAISAAIKLVPFMFMPILLLKIKGLNQQLKFLAAFCFFLLICLFPLFSYQVYPNYFQSFLLYFNRFEFNGSIYILFREVGKLLIGYNPIRYIGPFLSFVTLILMSLILFKTKKDEVKHLFYFILLYLVFSTTIHPWYLSFLLITGLFTDYKFPFLWSYVIGLTYFQYHGGIYRENIWIIGVEYSLVFILMIFEYMKINKTKDHVRN